MQCVYIYIYIYTLGIGTPLQKEPTPCRPMPLHCATSDRPTKQKKIHNVNIPKSHRYSHNKRQHNKRIQNSINHHKHSTNKNFRQANLFDVLRRRKWRKAYA